MYNRNHVRHCVREADMAIDFIPAEKVLSPRRHWSLISILLDPKKPSTCVLALGKWENEARLAMRWNGDKDSPIGNPQSRGLPTWFIVGPEFNDSLMPMVPPDKKALVQTILSEAK